MDSALEELVWQRASSRCEYCQFPANCAELPFQIDHIIAQKHGGTTVPENLALACERCNSYKGPNISGIDSATSQLVRLFHPRTDAWHDHFEWNGPQLVGKTSIARATIAVLEMNLPYRILLRAALRAEGVFPADLD